MEIKSKWQVIIMAVAILIILFCLSFLTTLKLVIEPRYDLLTKEGTISQMKELKETIVLKDHEIMELKEELERYRLFLEELE